MYWRFEKGFLVHSIRGFCDYDICLNNIRTVERLQEWTNHLSEKNWSHPQLIQEFRSLVIAHNRLKIDTGEGMA